MVRTRALIGVLLAGGFAALLAVDSWRGDGLLFHGLLALLVAFGLREFGHLARRGGYAPQSSLAMVMAVVSVVVQQRVVGGGRGSSVAGFYSFVGVASAAGFLVLAFSHLVWRAPERWLHDLSVTALGFFYVWLLGAHALAIRTGWGLGGVAAFVAAAKLGDVGAYLAGTSVGRHKLAPRLSPNKTVEGALGGLAASVGAALLVGCVLAEARLGVGFWAVFGLAVGVAAQAGDLVESALKRSVGAKDSNDLLPGFGGVLDLIDSPLVGAPVALWLFELWGRRLLAASGA